MSCSSCLLSKHKTCVQHLYNVGPTSSMLIRHCINVIQMVCVYWVVTFFTPPRHEVCTPPSPSPASLPRHHQTTPCMWAVTRALSPSLLPLGMRFFTRPHLVLPLHHTLPAPKHPLLCLFTDHFIRGCSLLGNGGGRWRATLNYDDLS